MRRSLATLLLAGVLGCGGEASETFTPAVPQLVPQDDPAWTGAVAGEPAVARVNGIPIPASRYRRALAKAADTDPEVLLRALIAEEAVAQAAVREPGFQPETLRTVFERSLVARLLEKRFVDEYRAEDVTEADLQPLWRIPAVSGRFNHLTIFVVQDFQWICCDGTPVHCATPEARACFAEGEAAVEATRAALVARNLESEDLPLVLEDLKVSAPRLAYQEYEFAYDEAKGIQKGRTIFDDAVVRAVVSTPVGRLAERPVRSRYGWHLPFVREIHPEVHKDLGDREVQRELASTFLDRLRQHRFFETIRDLVPIESFLSASSQLKGYLRDRAPRFLVTIDPEALDAWSAERTETEGM